MTDDIPIGPAYTRFLGMQVNGNLLPGVHLGIYTNDGQSYAEFVSYDKTTNTVVRCDLPTPFDADMAAIQSLRIELAMSNIRLILAQPRVTAVNPENPT